VRDHLKKIGESVRPCTGIIRDGESQESIGLALHPFFSGRKRPHRRGGRPGRKGGHNRSARETQSSCKITRYVTACTRWLSQATCAKHLCFPGEYPEQQQQPAAPGLAPTLEAELVDLGERLEVEDAYDMWASFVSERL
jgi:hypothetical protein